MSYLLGKIYRNLKEVKILEWIYHVGPDNLPHDYFPWKDTKDIYSLTEAIKNVFVREYLISLNSSVVVAVLYSLDLAVKVASVEQLPTNNENRF